MLLDTYIDFAKDWPSSPFDYFAYSVFLYRQV